MGRPFPRLLGAAEIAGSGGLALALLAPPRPVDSASQPGGAAVPHDPEKEAFFGETPIHTSYSFDAFLGGAKLDPDGAYLDRIQIIKGWVDTAGNPQEKIINVVWSGNRRPGPDGKLPAVGNTVDLKTARFTNTIGAPVLAGLWNDPDFDPRRPTLYYVRVLEIPPPAGAQTTPCGPVCRF